MDKAALGKHRQGQQPLQSELAIRTCASTLRHGVHTIDFWLRLCALFMAPKIFTRLHASFPSMQPPASHGTLQPALQRGEGAMQSFPQGWIDCRQCNAEWVGTTGSP